MVESRENECFMSNAHPKTEFAKIDAALYQQSLQSMVFDAIDRIIEQKPNHIACYNDVNDLSKSVTYLELKEKSLAIASFLHSKGYRRGEDAVFVLYNCWEVVAIWLAALFQGMSINGVSPKFGKLDTKQKIQAARSRVVFTTADSLEKIRWIRKECDTVEWIVVLGSTACELQEGEITFEEVLRTQVDRNRKPIPVQPEDVAFILLSSGTTGAPKIVLHTHRALVALLLNLDANMKSFWEDAFSRKFNWIDEHQIVVLLPLVHGLATYQLLLFLRKGVSFVMMQDFDAVKFCEAVEKFKVRMITTNPSKIRELIRTSQQGYDVRSIEWLMAGGSVMSQSLYSHIRSNWTHVQHVHQNYGMTEMFAPLIPDLRNDPFGSVGHAPPGVEVKVVDANGKTLPAGERGELCIKTPTLLKSYGNNNKEAMAQTVIDGWLHTGDLGYVNENGCVFPAGRKKELIKVFEYAAFPMELEDTLIADDRIADAAVIGVRVSEDPSDNELPKAFVVKADDSLTEHDVCAIIAENLAAYKQPKGGVEFLDVIPRTVIGKIDYHALKNRTA